MAKALVFRHGSTDLSFNLEKVDRKKLYGQLDTEVLDEQGRPCQLAILAGDGKTLVSGRGGSALLMLDPDGGYCDRATLKPVDPEGAPLDKVPSSFNAPVPLSRRASIDEYLSHNVKAVYALQPPMGADALLGELRGGAIYSFAFSYRGGLDPDVGFLLASSDGAPFLAVGKKTRLQFVALPELADPEAEADLDDEGDDDDDSMDFGMM
jgi:hypothetical protein